MTWSFICTDDCFQLFGELHRLCVACGLHLVLFALSFRLGVVGRERSLFGI
jgi:hypothetical protein